MTLHVVYDHKCGKCGAFYIPYDTVPCPKCSTVEEERFDYIAQAAASMEYNKATCGQYTPLAWWVGSLGDHILHLLFGLFDGYEREGAGENFEGYISRRLGDMQWGGQGYLSGHIQAIALAVRKTIVIAREERDGEIGF